MNALFKLPSGGGMKPRFVIAIIGLIAVLLLIIIFFFIYYGSHPIRGSRQAEIKPIDTESAISAIQKIESQPYPTAQEKIPKASKQEAPSSTTHPMPINMPIVVYHHDQKTPSPSPSIETISSSSRYTLKAGSIIPAILLTGIQSDLPGTVIARVRSHVFDTVTGNYLLIPQGSTLIGTYDSHLALNQSRLFIVWSQLIFPNGNTLNLRSEPGIDLAGLSGLHDLVDHHTLKIFGSGLLFSVLGAAAQLSQPQNPSAILTPQQIIAGSIGQQINQTSSQWMDKTMSLQPTLTIRPGTLFNVLVTHDLVFGGPYAF